MSQPPASPDAPPARQRVSTPALALRGHALSAADHERIPGHSLQFRAPVHDTFPGSRGQGAYPTRWLPRRALTSTRAKGAYSIIRRPAIPRHYARGEIDKQELELREPAQHALAERANGASWPFSSRREYSG